MKQDRRQKRMNEPDSRVTSAQKTESAMLQQEPHGNS